MVEFRTKEQESLGRIRSAVTVARSADVVAHRARAWFAVAAQLCPLILMPPDAWHEVRKNVALFLEELHQKPPKSILWIKEYVTQESIGVDLINALFHADAVIRNDAFAALEEDHRQLRGVEVVRVTQPGMEKIETQRAENHAMVERLCAKEVTK